jgi:hypothetical protein
MDWKKIKYAMDFPVKGIGYSQLFGWIITLIFVNEMQFKIMLLSGLFNYFLPMIIIFFTGYYVICHLKGSFSESLVIGSLSTFSNIAIYFVLNELYYLLSVSYLGKEYIYSHLQNTGVMAGYLLVLGVILTFFGTCAAWLLNKIQCRINSLRVGSNR